MGDKGESCQWLHYEVNSMIRTKVSERGWSRRSITQWPPFHFTKLLSEKGINYLDVISLFILFFFFILFSSQFFNKIALPCCLKTKPNMIILQDYILALNFTNFSLFSFALLSFFSFCSLFVSPMSITSIVYQKWTYAVPSLVLVEDVCSLPILPNWLCLCQNKDKDNHNQRH